MKNIRYKLSAVLGILLILGGLYAYQLRGSNFLANSEPSAPPATFQKWSAPAGTIQGDPVHFDIPSLDMHLPVINGQYDKSTGTWTLTDYAVQYAVITPPPNNSEGNTFFYGHYRRSVFENLHEIKPGAIATVTTSNGHTFTYKYTGNIITDPSNTQLFGYHGKPIMTVQTCEGLFYQHRQLFTFDLVGVK